MSNIKVWAGLTPLKALRQDPPCLLQRLATSLGSVPIFMQRPLCAFSSVPQKDTGHCIEGSLGESK